MYRILTFAANGHPTPFENKKYTTKEEAEKRLQELKEIYSLPMMVREVK